MKPDDKAQEHADLEQRAEILREELARDVEALARTPLVGTTIAARQTVQKARETVQKGREVARRIPPVLLAVVGALALLALLVLRHEAARHRGGA